MEEEDNEVNKYKIVGHSLDSISINELENYILDLENEIERVRKNIDEKKSALGTANSIFTKK